MKEDSSIGHVGREGKRSVKKFDQNTNELLSFGSPMKYYNIWTNSYEVQAVVEEVHQVPNVLLGGERFNVMHILYLFGYITQFIKGWMAVALEELNNTC